MLFWFLCLKCKTNKLHFSWKRLARRNISKQCHSSCYFGCALLSGCSQFFIKPVALDRCCVSIGWFESVQLVPSSSGLKLLPLWPPHFIHHCFPIHHCYHHNHCHCYPPLWTMWLMLEFAPFPAVIILIVVLCASKLGCKFRQNSGGILAEFRTTPEYLLIQTVTWLLCVGD